MAKRRKNNNGQWLYFTDRTNLTLYEGVEHVEDWEAILAECADATHTAKWLSPAAFGGSHFGKEASLEAWKRFWDGYYALVERSYNPSAYNLRYPWKRFSRRGYWWVVPVTEVFKNSGNRCIDSASIRIFHSRSDALKALYTKN